jgi:hypothetical protein
MARFKDGRFCVKIIFMSHSESGNVLYRVFSLSDWETWLARMSGAAYGLSLAEFETAWRDGALTDPTARHLAAALPLVRRLRAHALRSS